MNPRLSIIMEYENATTHDGDEVAPVFAALLRQYADIAVPPATGRDELILVFDSSKQDGGDIDRVIDTIAPALRERLDVRKLPRPGLRYYELKNAGAGIARGEILVFIDSDLEPEDGWLKALVAPFEDPNVTATAGHTYLGHDNFLSRTFALVWLFRLRDADEDELKREPLSVNNWAVRRSWFANNPFPDHPGFKVSCSLLEAEMRAQGVELLKVPAYGRHKPLEGLRFMLWRAAVAGRDDDSRYAAMQSPNRLRRLRRAFSRGLNRLIYSTGRIVFRHRAVGMSLYQIPAAVAVAWIYYTVFLAAQVVSALSGPRREPERIPDFVLRS